MYNPLEHKKPYGASAVGKRTDIKFPLDTRLGVKRVYIVLRKDGDVRRLELERVCGKQEDVFQISFIPDTAGIWNYRFEGEYADGTLCFFGRGDDGCAVKQDWLPEWQLTVSETDYKTPNWAKDGIIYHIFADRFCRVEDGVRPVKGSFHENWEELPDIAREGEDYRADDFFGGNIKGIISKLDYLASLNVSIIYLSPVFQSFSNHRYDTGDYLSIDGLFGTEEEFARLVSSAAERGMKVILDGVFNHTGADSIYFNKFGTYPSLGAYQSKQSPYYDWYYFDEFPDSYACWWGSTVVPTVNKDADGYKQLILGRDGVLEKWGRTGVSGWRLDVVDELPVDFTTELCGKIKSINPEALIIGEVWEDASTKVSYGELRPYFMGRQLDGVMNYPFKEAVLSYASSGDDKAFEAAVIPILENYPMQSLAVCMNLIGSHDTVRALTALSGASAPAEKVKRRTFSLSDEEKRVATARLKIATVLQYTLPGVPAVYYGDEAGAQGWEDPLNRATYPWGREDSDILEHYRALGDVRARYKEMLHGETFIKTVDGAVTVIRKSEEGSLYAVVNASDKDVFISYDVVPKGAEFVFGAAEDRSRNVNPSEFSVFVLV